MFDEVSALLLLHKCRGDEIWSCDTCRAAGVPESWIEELRDCFESGYDADRNTIYENDQMTNQYEGVRDRDLAFKIAEYLGFDPGAITALSPSRVTEVAAIKEFVEEE